MDTGSPPSRGQASPVKGRDHGTDQSNAITLACGQSRAVRPATAGALCGQPPVGVLIKTDTVSRRFGMNFSGVKILCVGDVMLDRFLQGDVERISPEAPVPVIRLRSRKAMLGGAGNVAHNIASLGGEAILLGLIGDDEF